MSSELETIKKKASLWLNDTFDKETIEQVQNLIDNDETELIESFYKDLEFGTGGLRGIMGVGTNRMNIYTVGMATQGLANYIIQQFPNEKELKVAIAHDCRNNSRLFAESTANIFSANGIKAYLFESLRPTPELSYAVREFGCQSGVVITASHNPKEYNGYKAYWNDGSQVTTPNDTNIIKEVKKVSDPSLIKFEANNNLIETIGEDFDEKYLNEIHALSINPDIIKKQKDVKIVYTPIHGTGVSLVPQILKKFGFENIINVPEQDVVSGDFPTVKSPNPEEPGALLMAIEKAKETGAELVMATDPDADRVGIAVKNDKGEYILLNGNETGVILVHYIVSQLAANNKLTGNEYTIKTIVSSDLFVDVAAHYGVESFECLTGFKHIAQVIRDNEGTKKFIGGGEESYGYLAGEFVRDKDAVMACALIAEAFAYAKEHGKSLYNMLQDIHMQIGMYQEKLVNVVRKGKSGAEEIQTMMSQFRNNPPKSLNGIKVEVIKDIETLKATNILTGESTDIDLPKSNVLQFVLEDGSKISVRPSGTEPKIKFYFSLNKKVDSIENYDAVKAELNTSIDAIIKELNL